MTDINMTSDGENGWRRFWNRGGFWRAILLTAIYFAVFNGASWLFALIGADFVTPGGGSFADPPTIFWGLLGPILVAGLVTLAIAASVGWLRDIFGPQPIGGSWWMWIAVAVVLLFNIANFARAPYGSYTPATVLSILALGLVVGFAEELITRGVVVNAMRKHGYGEWMVMFVSALTFALLHSAYFQSMGIVGGSIQVIYTFFFGVLMYLALRVTGSIIGPMLLHASTDPSVFLNTGAIGDTSAAPQSATVLDLIGAFSQWGTMLVGLVLIFFVRGRVASKSAATDPQMRTDF